MCKTIISSLEIISTCAFAALCVVTLNRLANSLISVPDCLVYTSYVTVVLVLFSNVVLLL